MMRRLRGLRVLELLVLLVAIGGDACGFSGNESVGLASTTATATATAAPPAAAPSVFESGVQAIARLAGQVGTVAVDDVGRIGECRDVTQNVRGLGIYAA